jgi:hypothetical protein
MVEIVTHPWPNMRPILNFFSHLSSLHLLCYKCKRTLQDCVDDDAVDI